MYQKELLIDDRKVKINLETEIGTGKPILDMAFLQAGFRQTISSDELSTDLENLNPHKFGENPFGGNEHVIMTMMEQLKKVIENHIKHYKRMLQSDLGTYVTESIIILDAYYEQVLGESFENKKKETFQMYFNFFYKQFPPEWNK
ncbi:hypothetical protein [uncultured Winogradskyella sp.]|mgnify:FL=1|uniref:hypothetical protein n=1 Tax=uncultured Winogradskyella sp. TaxID=395353 RepID=UPI0030EF9618|tara:strand:+ start:180 stop:614 length:435 start_codon:yes stop_codon:yes gene_type:complete